jgi:acyl-homoserine lactone acylase PvdQ
VTTKSRIALTLSSVVALVAATFTTAQIASSATAPSHAYRADDYADGQAMSILPPGENGLVTVSDAAKFELLKQRPPASDDQLTKYENLLYGYQSVTDGTLGNYYDDASFGVPPGELTRTEKPEAGVTVYRDTHDIPHVYADNDQTLAFGAGFAQAEDRLFLMDVLRHYGSGNLAGFLGASCDFEQMDHDQLLLAPYTKAQAIAQVNALPGLYGAEGTLAKSMIYNYVNGVNAYIRSAVLNPTKLPADYAAALPGIAPTTWTVADVVSIAGLIGGIFGRGGGAEIQNAHLLQYLKQQLGATNGTSAFRQLRTANDPLAPTTADQPFPYETPGTINPALTALPDYNAPITGGPTGTTKGCAGSSALGAASASSTGASMAKSIVAGLNSMPSHMSNALVVNASHSVDGHPIAVFGPQVSYFAPQILSQLDLHSPDYAAEGASFPGTGIVELGRGQDYAWSATSAGSDLIDMRIEKICNPLGGAPQANGKYYLFNGHCTAMTVEHFKETALPKLGGLGQPAGIDHVISLTRHGVVQGWTTVNGQPVAIVMQRSTYNHDVDSIIGFIGFGQPGKSHDVTSWMANAANINYTFNWFYADDQDTGYFVSGADPIRPSDVDPDLPTWGTGGAEWQGFLPAAQHVHESDPPTGFFVSWNNKPAPQFAAADDQYGYGQVFRSQMLVNQLNGQLAAHGGLLTRANVVQAMETAASQDLDGVSVIPLLLQYLSGHSEPAGVQAMIDRLQSWVTNGAHRHKASPSDTQYAEAAAVAIADELFPNLIHALYDGVLGAGGSSSNGFNALPMSFVDSPNQHQGSSYDGGYEGYVVATLQQLLGQSPVDGFDSVITSHECSGGQGTCGAAIDAALATTYNALVAANGSSNVASWTASTASKAANQAMPAWDAIHFRVLGLVGQPDIDWQNRPTFQQVIEFPRHRPR